MMDTCVSRIPGTAVLGHTGVGIMPPDCQWVMLNCIIFPPIMQKGTCSSVIFRPRKRFSGYLDLLWRNRKGCPFRALRSDPMQCDCIMWDWEAISCSCNHTSVQSSVQALWNHTCQTQTCKLERGPSVLLFYVSISVWFENIWPIFRWTLDSS